MRKNKKDVQLDSDSYEELSYQRLDDSSFHPTNIRKSKFLPRTYQYFLSGLECFVIELLSNDEVGFVPYLGNYARKCYTPTSLAIKYFESVPDFIDVVNRLSPKYEYSEPINAFITCCDFMGLLNEHLDWRLISNASKKTYPCFRGVSAPEIFNMLVQNIRIEWKKKQSPGKS
jgi:hypothetical protein